MYYTYLITNTVNGKKYFGVRNCEAVTPERDGKYLGSGVLVKRAVKKYGRDAFTKKVDGKWETSDEAYKREREVVNKEWVEDKRTYNLRIGGLGGVIASEETRKKISKHSREVKRTEEWGKNLSLSLKGREFSKDERKKMSISQKRRFKDKKQWNKGKTCDDNPSLSRFIYEIITTDGEVLIIENGLSTFYRERFGTTRNLFRRYFNKGKIKPAKGKQSVDRKKIVGWEIKKYKKKKG